MSKMSAKKVTTKKWKCFTFANIHSHPNNIYIRLNLYINIYAYADDYGLIVSLAHSVYAFSMFYVDVRARMFVISFLMCL